MARYTELFSEYLAREGNELPTMFADIVGFGDLFVGVYCDKEIGFETEELFKVKLETYANIFIPRYKEQIDAYVKSFTEATNNPTKIYYEEGSLNLKMGKQTGYTKDLPYDSQLAEPTAMTETDAYENNNNNTVTRKESGTTASEAIEIMERLNKKVNILIINLMEEFRPLFMNVY